jgi:methionyl-tRNA synthetase
MSKKFLITAALPYANGPLHLGHIAGAYLPADVFSRFQKAKKNDVVFICGTDEHGVPITIKAEKEGISPQELVDRYHKIMKDSFEKLGIDFTYFSRTSAEIHHETAQEFFTDIKNNGFLDKKESEQLQCQSCETFLADRYVEGICPHCGKDGARGDQCESCGKMLSPTELIEPVCKVCGSNKIELKNTYHYYIKLAELQPELEKWIGSKEHWKDNVVNFCKNWFNEGLGDRAVTRDLKWGVPVPNEENKVLYVWFDAPIGYISMTKEWAKSIGKPELWKDYWKSEDSNLIHFIGKDNIVFHALMFPAMLMAKKDGFVLPENIPANEFLNLEGDKLSTSRNYAVWVNEYLEKFPADSLRYYLAANAPENKDADFSWKNFQTHHNSELANTLGNFVNRALTFVNKYFDGILPERTELDELDELILSKIDSVSEDVGFYLERYELRKATETMMEFARFANKYFNDQEPWKTRNDNIQKCGTTLNLCAQAVKKMAIIFQPVLPFSSQKMWKMLHLEGNVADQNWDKFEFINSGEKIGEPEILFSKLDDKFISSEIERLEKIKEKNNKAVFSPEKIKPEITFDDFSKIDFRMGTVKSAEKIKKAKKLLKLVVDIGLEERQVVSGIAEFYKPEELVGKQIVFVANLKPVKLRGVESQGMILAVENESGGLDLISSENKKPNGAVVR